MTPTAEDKASNSIPSNSPEPLNYLPPTHRITSQNQDPSVTLEQNWNSWLEGARKGTSFIETKRDEESHVFKEGIGEGIVTDTISYENLKFWKDNFIPVPDVDKITRRRRTAALRRHGFTSLSDRPALARYAAHARRVFRAEFACFVLASAHKSQCVLLGEKKPTDEGNEGDQPTCRVDEVTQGLIKPSESFVIKDADEDFQIQNNPSLKERSDRNPSKARFFASVPLFLSLPGEKEDSQVAVGRLCIVSALPRPYWGDDDTKLLAEISLMTAESLERESQVARSKRVSSMQRATAFLARSVEEPHMMGGHSCSEGAGAPVQTSDGFNYCPKRVQLACSQIQKAVRASCVYVLDTSTFKFVNSSRSSASGDSPRSSFYHQSPWISSPLTPPTEFGSNDGSESSPSLKRSKSRPHFRSISSQFSAKTSNQTPSDEGEVCPTPESGPTFVASENSTTAAKTFGAHQRRTLAAWLGNWKKEGRLQRPATYFNTLDSDTSDDTDEEPFEMSNRNPLAPLLLDPETVQYSAMPVFGLDNQPLFIIISTFNEKAVIEEECCLFIESSAAIIRSSILRQAVMKADSQAHLFVRSVQHELRTPLHAILGLCDFIRGSLNGDLEVDERVDLSDDSVLVSLLEAIRLAGTNLNTILDDVLDFGQSTGISGSAAERRVEDVDLNRLIEDVAGDELEHLHLTKKIDDGASDRVVHAATLGSARYPELIIKMNPLLERQRWRVDSTSLQKILRKLISNSLRFTEQGYVEVSINPTQGSSQPEGEHLICFTVRDTGPGMTREFIETKLLKPFTKGSSFKQGSGLGFTVASALAERMSGRILVRSVVGEGTEVDLLVPLLNLGSFQAPPLQKYQVSTAHFIGFGSAGSQKVRDLIQEELEEHDVKMVESAAQAESIIISEDQLSESLGESIKNVKDSVRIIVVTGNLIAKPFSTLPSNCGEALSGRPIRFLKPPFGSSLLRSLSEFLQEETPFRLFEPRKRRQISEAAKEAKDQDEGPPQRRHPSGTTEPDSVPSTAVQEPSDPTQNQSSNNDAEFRVLIVEDNPINMKLLSTICERMKIKIEKAEDGLQAIQKFIAFKPSLVLLDISIPIHDGFEVCQMMRAHKLEREPRIVAVTALSSQQDKNRGMDLGMNDWRQKPVSMKGIKTDLAGWKALWEAAHGSAT